MRSRTSLAVGCVVAGLVLVLAALDARAAGGRTYLTFSQPVGLPGVSLAAGTYTFEEVASGGVVRVSSRDGRMVYLTAFTRQVERPASLKAAPELVLGEAPLDAPTPIEAWFPNGGRRGHAFIY